MTLRTEYRPSYGRILAVGVALLALSMMVLAAISSLNPRQAYLYHPARDEICYANNGIISCVARTETGISLEAAMKGTR